MACPASLGPAGRTGTDPGLHNDATLARYVGACAVTQNGDDWLRDAQEVRRAALPVRPRRHLRHGGAGRHSGANTGVPQQITTTAQLQHDATSADHDIAGSRHDIRSRRRRCWIRLQIAQLRRAPFRCSRALPVTGTQCCGHGGARSLHPIGTQAKVEGSLRREPLGGGYRSSTVAQVLATPSLNPQLTRGDLITGP
jgi:hypothetical protein